MVFILTVLHVLLFGLCAGAIISVIVFVPLGIYVIPYALWVGSQNTKGKHPELKNEKFFRTVRNATRLYKAKLSGHEPIFK